MKRIFVLTLVLALILALALPAAAFAKRGGVPANGNGKGSAVSKQADESVAPAELAPEAPKGKDKKDKARGDDTEEGVDLEAEVEAPDTEESEESEEKLTGIANALSRLQRNLARKQAAFEAGTAKGLPAGLQATIAKFMSWLGIEPAEEGPDDGLGELDTLEDVDAPDDSPEAPEESEDTP